MGDVLKAKDLNSMRMRGQISREEHQLILNMLGRNLEAMVESTTIAFRERKSKPTVASIERTSKVATLYPEKCCGDVGSYYNGIVAAQYSVSNYTP